MSGHAIWYACAEAARHAGLKKRVAPHMLRHYTASPTMPLKAKRNGESATGMRCFVVDKARKRRHSLRFWD